MFRSSSLDSKQIPGFLELNVDAGAFEGDALASGSEWLLPTLGWIECWIRRRGFVQAE